jgi:hypothetical protein
VETFAFQIVGDRPTTSNRDVEADAGDAYAEKQDQAIPLADSPASAFALDFSHRSLMAFLASHLERHRDLVYSLLHTLYPFIVAVLAPSIAADLIPVEAVFILILLYHLYFASGRHYMLRRDDPLHDRVLPRLLV